MIEGLGIQLFPCIFEHSLGNWCVWQLDALYSLWHRVLEVLLSIKKDCWVSGLCRPAVKTYCV